jgi:hypothetical protein
MKKAGWIWLAAVALAVQVAGLGWLIARYERVLAEGEVVRIPCAGFDPSDPLRGRYLQVTARLECNEVEGREGDEWQWDWYKDRKRYHALLEPADGEGPATHRVSRVALSPGEEGLWVKASECWGTWNPEEKKYKFPARVTFPGKLFLDERLAGEADRIFRERLGEAEGKRPVAVYRAWKGQFVIADVELDGVSIHKLARRAREEAAADGKKKGES